MARGRFLLVTEETGADLLANRAFVEQVLRTFTSTPLAAQVFADPDRDGDFPFQLIPGDVRARPYAVAWPDGATRREDPLPERLTVGAGHEIEGLVRALAKSWGASQWRVAPRRSRSRPPDVAGARLRTIRRPGPSRPSERLERQLRFTLGPALPGEDRPKVSRWEHAWTPPETAVLCRHKEIGSERRVVTLRGTPPPGFALEFHLGCARLHGTPGTAALVELGGPRYVVGAPADDAMRRQEGEELGHLELAPLPLLDALLVGRHRTTGEDVLVAATDDPLRGEVEARETLGYVEPYPIRPRTPAHVDRRLGLIGLSRGLDLRRRRHVYGIGRYPPGELVCELGAMHDEPEPGSLAIRVTTGGRLAFDGPPEPRPAPSLRIAARYALAPLGWQGVAPAVTRTRSAGRRAVESLRSVASRRPVEPMPASESAVVGYLFGEHAPGRLPLYVADHPVTDDQLLTRSPLEAADMGYGPARLVGHLLPFAPVTGSLASREHAIPWAAKFGTRVRRS